METAYILCLLYHAHYVLGHIPVKQPTFLDTTTTWDVEENSTAWLPCTIENLGENVVRWWRKDSLLADSSDHTHPRPPRMRLWANNTLEIGQVQRDDAAEYVCQVVRKEPWNPLQQTQQLTVLYSPEIFAEPASGVVDVRLGETTEIACLATGSPAPQVTWKAQDKDIANDNEKPHVLILQANSPKIAQTYTCTADNGVGEPATAVIRVNILYKPIVIADVSWLHAAPGLHAELVCRVGAEPAARVQWFADGKLVEYGSSPRIAPYVQGSQHVLKFQNITVEDFGIYSCRANNSEGVSEATVELSGRARPATFKREMARWNASAKLIWEVDSYSPIVDYSLKFRQVPAPDDGEWKTIIIPADGGNPGPIHSKSYTLSGLQTASTYEAVVTSRNRYGTSSPSAPFLFSTEGAEHAINGSNEDDSNENSLEESNAVAIDTVFSAPSAYEHSGSSTKTLTTSLLVTIIMLQLRRISMSHL